MEGITWPSEDWPEEIGSGLPLPARHLLESLPHAEGYLGAIGRLLPRTRLVRHGRRGYRLVRGAKGGAKTLVDSHAPRHSSRDVTRPRDLLLRRGVHPPISADQHPKCLRLAPVALTGVRRR